MDQILVIDDSPVQAEFLRSLLVENYEVTICSTAAEGLEKAKNGGFSLILLDIIMPDMDGFTMLRELQETAVTKYVPVILITSLSDVQNEERGLAMGAVDYITKPFSPTIARARVNTHIRLYHYQSQVRRQALVDELTGSATRRRYEEDSVIRWREAMALGLPFSICMFDIDKFKLYNDTYGHPAGDKVIASVARQAAAYFQRATDFLARYGGEEFVAILIGNDAGSAFALMRQIRKAIEDLQIPASSPVSPWVTVSMGGVTLTPKKGDSYDTYLKIADTMLYDAKNMGRNMVIWSDAGRRQWVEDKGTPTPEEEA